MSNEQPRLRGNSKQRKGPYPLGEFPPSIVTAIGKQLVHRMAVGQADITGDDFGTIFASAISGDHRGKPLGVADVSHENCAWSVKTVKADQPFTQTPIRVISGRNSPAYSKGIKTATADVQATGRAVLEVWNRRVDKALSEFDDLRVLIMVRNMSTLEFTLFEHEAHRFIPTEYVWQINANNNFQGLHTLTKEHVFTWQPHGSQFTVIHPLPSSCYRFKIKKRPMLIQQQWVMNLVKWEDDWIIPMNPPQAEACASGI